MPLRLRTAPTSKPTKGPAGSGCVVKVTLRGVKPAVWRRLQIASDLTLRDLHHALQVAMGWTDSHLHEFDVEGSRYGMPDPQEDFGEPSLDERKFTVGDVLREGARAEYLYDFGDGWRHQLKVERVAALPAGSARVQCLAGARSCPPEDCGGPYGHADLLEALADPGNERHAELKEWVGPYYDPEAFDLAAINRDLRGVGSAAWRRKRERYYG